MSAGNPNVPPGLNPLLQLTPNQVNRAESAPWRQIIRQALADTRCATPAFLTEDMDVTAQTVSAQIAIQERVRTATTPGTAWMDIPPIKMVPLLIPRGGGFSQTFPLKKGDEGLLIFCDTCFDFWWKNGTANAPKASNVTAPSGSQKQNEVRRHYLHDCGFLPTSMSRPNVLADYSVSSMQSRADDGSAYIDVAKNVITVSGADSVALVAPLITASDGVGMPQFLVTADWRLWFTTNVIPFLISKGYSGPGQPIDSQTTVLKGQ